MLVARDVHSSLLEDNPTETLWSEQQSILLSCEVNSDGHVEENSSHRVDIAEADLVKNMVSSQCTGRTNNYEQSTTNTRVHEDSANVKIIFEQNNGRKGVDEQNEAKGDISETDDSMTFSTERCIRKTNTGQSQRIYTFSPSCTAFTVCGLSIRLDIGLQFSFHVYVYSISLTKTANDIRVKLQINTVSLPPVLTKSFSFLYSWQCFF